MSPRRTAGALYVVVGAVLWWTYPSPPRCVVEAGPDACFMCFSPDSRRMLTLDQSDRPGPYLMQVWNVETGDLLCSVPVEHRQPHVHFTPDSKRVHIRDQMFQADTGLEIHRKHQVARPQFAPREPADVSVFVSSGASVEDRERILSDVTVVDTESNRVRFAIPEGTAAEVRGDGQELVVAVDLRPGPPNERTGPARWEARLLDPKTGEVRRAVAEGEGFARWIAYLPANDKIAVGVWNTTPEQTGIQIWNLATAKHEQTMPVPWRTPLLGPEDSLEFLAEGRVLSMTSLLHGSRIWDLTTPGPDGVLTPPQDSKLTLRSDGQLAATWVSAAQEVVVWRLGSGKREIASRKSYPNPNDNPRRPLAFTAEGNLIVYIREYPGPSMLDWIGRWLPWNAARLDPHTGSFDILDPADGRLVQSLSAGAGTTPHALSPDGRTLVTSEFRLRQRDCFTLWDVPAKRPWPAILTWPLLPAIVLGLLVMLWARLRSKVAA